MFNVSIAVILLKDYDCSVLIFVPTFLVSIYFSVMFFMPALTIYGRLFRWYSPSSRFWRLRSFQFNVAKWAAPEDDVSSFRTDGFRGGIIFCLLSSLGDVIGPMAIIKDFKRMRMDFVLTVLASYRAAGVDW